MPFEVMWDNAEKTIIRCKVTEIVTLDDLIKSNEIVFSQMKTQSGHVHIILDASATNQFPVNIFSAISHLNNNLPDNTGLIILVRQPGNLFLSTVERVAKSFMERIIPLLHVTYTLEEAYRIIETKSAASP